MLKRARAFAVCLLQSGIWQAVLYSLQEDEYYVEMQCTNSYGHNKEPCWLLYITTFHCQNMKKRPIENKGILSAFCTFMKRLVSYITWALNNLMDLLSYHYRILPVLYEALLSVMLSVMKLYMSTSKFESHMVASLLLHWKSNNVCPFPHKLLISHWLPVLSGSNPEMAHVSTQGVPGHPTPKKKTSKRKDSPSHHPLPPPKKKKKKKKKKKEKRKKDKKEKKEKKEGAIFANPPLEDSLVDEPL